MINVPYGNSVIRYIANYDKMFRCRLQILFELLGEDKKTKEICTAN